MNAEKLAEILKKHKLWLDNKEGGERANLSRANLSGANLSGANLSRADLCWADLYGANLSGANLSRADLCLADLSVANLSGANLYGANLSGANLSGANLYGANLYGADLSGANLFGANLSNCIGLLSSSDFLSKFEQTLEGIIVYKAFCNTTFNPNPNWKIEAGQTISEIVNRNATEDCGCGVNVASLEWCKKNYARSEYWRCLIPWNKAFDVVVPYNTDGKFRCGTLKLLERVK